MIISSKLFRKVFLYVQAVIILFFVGLLVFAAPYLEKQLYRNEETVAITFLDNVVTMIRGELRAIDSYWKSSIEERQNKQQEITELQIAIILNRFNRITESAPDIRLNIIKQELLQLQIKSSGKLLAIDKKGAVIFHNDKNLINRMNNEIKDAYGSPVFSTEMQNYGAFIQYWTIENNQEIEKNIYYQFVPELSLYIGMEFYSNNILDEVKKREEQIINNVQSLISKLSIRSNGQLLILDNGYNIKIPPDFNQGHYKSICKSGIINNLKQQTRTSNNILRLQWGGDTSSKDCSINMIGWNFYFTDFDWNILLVHKKNELYKTSDELKNRLIISIALMVLALNILALLFIRKISIQIGSLSQVAENVGKGDLQQQANVTSNDELGRLAISINSMIDNIRERTEKLNQLNTNYLAAKTAADKANISKTRFLAAVSHDLMQPLNAAKLYISSLHIGAEEQRKNDQEITSKSISAINMAEQMINELVDISKLDAGEIKPHLENFPISEILKQLEASFKVLAEKWKLEFKVIDSSCFINSDKRFLKHILQNFISNAIRYTSSGKIVLGCRREAGNLSIQVWDTGPGIPENEQELIFQEFVKGKTTSDKGENRFGLGLAIVKKMASILNVDIKLKSWVGKGTVFSVQVPIAEGNLIEEYSANSDKISLISAENKLKDKDVICIDDDLTSLDALDTILRKLGSNPTLISSIDEIDDLEGDDINKCALIFSDYSLQDGATGLDAIKLIKEKLGREVPAIIITGEKSEEVKDACSQQGHVVVRKPASIEILIKSASKLL